MTNQKDKSPELSAQMAPIKELSKANANKEKQKLNGRTVPIERRKEVRLDKSQAESPLDSSVTYKVAMGKKELESAFSLVWKNYVETGLQRSDDIGMRFTKYHFLPSTKVFIANFHEELAAGDPSKFKGDGKCVGTVTLIVDSPMGLPMEEFCSDEIAEMRAEGKKLAEVVAFAVDPTYAKYKVFLHMFKLLFQFADMKGVTDLCCSVTERHIRFYRRVCLFEPMGELMPYTGAYKLKVQGHRLNIADANKKAKEFYGGREFDADLHRFFFGENYNREKGEGKPISSEELEYFLTEKTSFIEDIDDKDLNILRSEYECSGSNFPF
ncbi:hypothetical protein [Vibrio sp. HN007]|uniref:N-acyl amino acid synthase FeeM domain-containing protein n=1 Tax=Vibrio iocasae TaxID=3098914 RepID=UPI0035D4095B